MFQTIELTLSGKQYKVKPTMDLIRRLELTGCGPFAVSSMLAQGQPAFAVYAEVIAQVVQQGGGDITGEALYQGLMEQGRVKELMQTATTIVAALIPPRPVKAAGMETGTAAKKTRAPRTTSRSGTKRQSST